jgi:hypothetical protein
MDNLRTTPTEKPYARAFKKVKELKSLYGNIAFFVPGSILVLMGEQMIIDKLAQSVMSDTSFLNWISWNIRLIPFIWLMVILIQALCIYLKYHKPVFHIKKPLFLKRWEESQIDKFLKEENSPPTDKP